MEFLILIIVLLLVGIFWRLGKITSKEVVGGESMDKLAGGVVEKLEEIEQKFDELKESIDLGFDKTGDLIEHFRKSSGALDDLEHEAELFEISEKYKTNSKKSEK